jgi:hypothetical protein
MIILKMVLLAYLFDDFSQAYIRLRIVINNVSDFYDTI